MDCRRIVVILALVFSGVAASWGSDLMEYRLPANYFQGWALLRSSFTDNHISQIWRRNLTGLSKGISGYSMVSYQVERTATTAEAAQRVKSLLDKQRYSDYAARGYQVNASVWTVRGRPEGIIFDVRGLGHSTERAEANHARVYTFALSQENRVAWFELRDSVTADELDGADRALQRASNQEFAELLVSSILAMWAQTEPAPDPETEPEPSLEPIQVPVTEDKPAETAAKPETSTDPAPEQQPESATNPETETKPATAPDPKPAEETKPEPVNADPVVETKPESKPETTPVPVVEPKVEPKTDEQPTPVTETKPETNTETQPEVKPESPAPRWQPNGGGISLILPTGWAITKTAPYDVTTGMPDVLVRLAPVETFKDDKEYRLLLDDFVDIRRAISLKGFSRHVKQIGDVRGAMVNYTNYAHRSTTAFLFGGNGQCWLLEIELPQAGVTTLPAEISALIDSIELK